MKLCDDLRALSPFTEAILWRQDKSPHLEGTFDAVVLQGESQSESTGNSRGTFPADPWTVIVDSAIALCADFHCGDTLTRRDGTVLSVQQISRTDGVGWVIKATANAAVPK